jgi:hypothetical protein
MSMRKIAIVGAALALAFGCERFRESGAEEQTETPEQGGGAQGGNVPGATSAETPTGESAETSEEVGTRFEQAPDRVPQAPPRTGGTQQTPQTPAAQVPAAQVRDLGQIISQQSQQNLDRTISGLTRGMRQNELDVVAQIRLDPQTRQRLLQQAEGSGQAQGAQQAQPTQQARPTQRAQPALPGQVGDVRLIMFRNARHEAQAIQSRGAEALLDMPHAVLVYERGENVIVAYRNPPMVQGAPEPTAEILGRVVRSATQPERAELTPRQR